MCKECICSVGDRWGKEIKRTRIHLQSLVMKHVGAKIGAILHVIRIINYIIYYNVISDLGWKDTMVPASFVFRSTSNINGTAPTGQGESLPCRQSCCESRGALNMLNNRFFVLLTFANTDSVGFRLQTGSNAPHSNYALDPQPWPIISQVFEKCGFASMSCSCFHSGIFEIYMFCGATWFPLPSRYDLVLP